MMRKNHVIMCFTIVLLLGACGKKEKVSDKGQEAITIGNGGNQINIESVKAPGGEADNKESDLEVGKQKSDTLIIVIDWDKILIDDSECGDIEEMKARIIESGCKTIDLQHTDANKDMLDKVIESLKEVEETLEITVIYH